MYVLLWFLAFHDYVPASYAGNMGLPFSAHSLLCCPYNPKAAMNCHIDPLLKNLIPLNERIKETLAELKAGKLKKKQKAKLEKRRSEQVVHYIILTQYIININ